MCYQMISNIAQMKRMDVLSKILCGVILILFLVGSYFEKTSQKLSKFGI